MRGILTIFIVQGVLVRPNWIRAVELFSEPSLRFGQGVLFRPFRKKTMTYPKDTER
jgi:hypothetical protein